MFLIYAAIIQQETNCPIKFVKHVLNAKMYDKIKINK
jgi:hypothetical protein